MLVKISDIKMHSIVEHIERMQHSSDRYRRAAEQIINEAKTKKPSLQLYKKIKAIVVKILCNVNPFDHNTHFITEKILAQNTYYKTLTSRP